MPAWKFTDDYGTQYPALNSSILSLLVFSEHTIAGTNFTGTLDVAASGAAMATIGAIVNLTSIGITGTVTNENNILNVTLTTPDHAPFIAGISSKIPLIGPSVTRDAWIEFETLTATADDPDEGPQLDAIVLHLVLNIGNQPLSVTTQVPMNGGFFTITGDFSNIGITLDDLNFLMGGKGPNQWFPGSELGPYYRNQPALSILRMSLTAFVNLKPFSVQMSSVTVVIGITGIPLMDQALYLNPLAVWVTVTEPVSDPQASWGIEGAIVLCNYADRGNYKSPDFSFEFVLGLTDFTISGQLENPSNKSINVMLQDLLGQGTSVGLGNNLTVNAFTFDAEADKTTGTIAAFSTEIALSGGFGLFPSFDIERFSMALTYSG
jgi:hypothetical protein